MTSTAAKLVRQHQRDSLGLCVPWCWRCAAEAEMAMRQGKRARAPRQGSLFVPTLVPAAAELPLPVRLVLPFVTPSLNEWANWHYLRRHRWGLRAERALVASLRLQGLPVDLEGGERRAVTVERYGRPGHVLDDDNLRGGCKGLVDALRRLGLVRDDSPRWMTATYSDVRRRGETPHTVVTIAAAPCGPRKEAP